MSQITHVVKRNGTLVPFTPERITNAIYRAAVAVGGRDRKTSEELAAQVVALLEQNNPAGESPSIEQIQDMVEKILIENGHARVAKAYILYRDERARQRDRLWAWPLHREKLDGSYGRTVSSGKPGGRRFNGGHKPAVGKLIRQVWGGSIPRACYNRKVKLNSHHGGAHESDYPRCKTQRDVGSLHA